MTTASASFAEICGGKNSKKIEWGSETPDDTEEKILGSIDIALDLINKGEFDYEKKIKYVQNCICKLVDATSKIIKNEYTEIDNSHKTNDEIDKSDKDVINSLKKLSTTAKSFNDDVEKSLSVVNTEIEPINNKKTAIINKWYEIINSVENNGENKHNKNNVIDDMIYDDSNVAIDIGLTKIDVPITLNSSKVPPMNIMYNPKIKSFLINLGGDIYSFGTGKFISMRAYNGVIFYGRRCSLENNNQCSKKLCKYFHDPLTNTNKPHNERSMSIQYIVDDLLNPIATNQDIISIRNSSRNKNIVKDLVQLAGMILIKAMNIKFIKSQQSKNSRRNNNSNYSKK